MILRSKTILTTSEYKELLNHLGQVIIGTEVKDNEYYTTITDGTGYKTYHFITDNDIIQVPDINICKVTFNLSDAKDSVVTINSSNIEIPESGKIVYEVPEGEVINYSIKLTGWKVINESITIKKSQVIKLKWIKDE